MVTKVCGRCMQEKDISQFPPRGDGYRGECRICINAYFREYRKKHPEKGKNYRRKSKARQAVAARNWYLNNTEKVKSRTREWHRKNPESVKRSKKKWNDNNKEKMRERWRIYRARKASL